MSIKNFNKLVDNAKTSADLLLAYQLLRDHALELSLRCEDKNFTYHRLNGICSSLEQKVAEEAALFRKTRMVKLTDKTN